MSQSASQAAAFYREVAVSKRLWTIKDDGGFPSPLSSSGERALPVWSSLSRVERIIRTVPAYAGFRPQELTWDVFRDRWVPGMTRVQLLVGINWGGAHATGYDIDPASVQKAVEFQLSLIAEASAGPSSPAQ